MSPYRLDEFQAFKAVAGGLPTGTPRRILIASFITFLAVILVYLGLRFGYKLFLENSIEDLRTEAEVISAEVSVEEQENLITLYSQINNLQKVLAAHVDVTPAFTFLEASTHPRVVFESADISVADQELRLEGAAGSYEDLAAQLAIFENNPSVEKVFLESSSAAGSVVRFQVTLEFEPKTFSVKK
ncbi:MAG: hypothetical protein HYS89_00170 [Candidatus Colwellbacteria bacterium]|nr:hypothetical protein [Candidatus Colwellbacteria bacterium]